MKDFLEIGKKVILIDEANKDLNKLMRKFENLEINEDFNSGKLAIENRIASLENDIYIISHRMMREAQDGDITTMNLMGCLMRLKNKPSSDNTIIAIGIFRFIKDKEVVELAFMRNSLNLFEKSSFAAFKVGNLANMDIDSVFFSIKEKETDIREIDESIKNFLNELEDKD